MGVRRLLCISKILGGGREGRAGTFPSRGRTAGGPCLLVPGIKPVQSQIGTLGTVVGRKEARCSSLDESP